MTEQAAAPMGVLLVEDDPDDVVLCRDAIAHSGLYCQLFIAGDLRGALARLDDAGADVALVDLSLPDAQELEAVTALAQRFPHLPIVVLTGLSDEQAVTAALQGGAEDYLVKGPGSRETLGRAVRYAIERKRGEHARREKDASEAANRAKSIFISRMSHELRTPLTAILGFAQILELECADEKQDFARHIVSAGHHLLGLISELIDYARVDAGEATLSVEPVNLGVLVNEVTTLIWPLAADKGVTVRYELGESARLDVLADRQRLSQVLLNLMSNAVKYNRVGGTVDVRCALRDDVVRVEITDTGPGLAPEQLASLFTPFQRLGAEASGVEGTGLGLVITKRLVEAMGATMGLSSTEGHGTTAWSEWPVAGVRPHPTVAAATPARPVLPVVSQAASATVLYIEDNLVNIELVQRATARRPGLRVSTARTGAEGLAQAKEDPPAVILLDLHLPDMHGTAVLDLLREDPRLRDIPVIVLTADATMATRDQAVAAGTFAFLTKPFLLDVLIDTIESALRLTGSPAQPHPHPRS